MPIDPSIILQGRAPQLENPMDVLTKGLTLKSLAQQSQAQDAQMAENAAVKNAFKNNLITNPDGTTSINKNAALSDIAKYSPQKYMDYDKMFRDQDLQKMAQDTAKVKQFAWSVTPENYSQVRQQMIDAKMPNAEQMPTQYVDSFVKNWQIHTLSGEEQLNQRIKQQELDMKKEDFALQRQKLYGGAPGVATSGSQGGARSGATGAASSGAKAPASLASTDPATLVSHYVPEKHQQKAFDEIEAAQNTRANADEILKAFDDAAARRNKSVNMLPWGPLNADQKKLHAVLGPTFKDIEGTVRQAAMDNTFENTTPQGMDSDETVAKKREALVDYMKSKGSSPVAKGYGIDLSKFDSTYFDDKSTNSSEKPGWAK